MYGRHLIEKIFLLNSLSILKTPLQLPKFGYVATEVGSWMQFTINTASTTVSDFPDPHTVVTLSHLRSYGRMGQASAPRPPKPSFCLPAWKVEGKEC